MIRFFIKRFISLVFSLFFVITFTFFLMKAIPGNPFLKEQSIPKEILDNLYRHYGFDQPLFSQYLLYLKQFANGSFGTSFIYEGKSVSQIVIENFPISLRLGLQTLFISIFLGIFIGSIAALKKNKWQDKCSIGLTTIGISVPSFILATILQYFLAMKFQLFPVAKWGTFYHTLLPTLSLSALPTAFIARLTRANMIEILQKDYIKTAYAKGVSSFRLIFFHALRNAILPIMTYIGPMSTNIIVGSFVVEQIFGIPGLGRWLLMSIMNRDYPLIMGLCVFFSTLLMVTIFIMDILYNIIDPRISIYKKR